MRPERRAPPAPIAFLFLGESLLVPHLYPIVPALSALDPSLPIDLWVGDINVETLLRERVGALPMVRLRRAPGFHARDGRPRPRWSKLVMLARIAPLLRGVRVAVCAEQTSLWLPMLLPLRTRFIKTSHGVGSMSARDDWRRRAAWHMLVPSELERRTYLDRGFAPERVVATGYIKASFARSAPPRRLFADDRPVVLYTPHWQRHRSSWWDWGRDTISLLVAQARYNVILAPHQRLIERDPGLAEALAEVAHHRHVHIDLGSPALVDGSYTALADIYLGDTSSQVVEFLADPRPCVFLNSARLDWRQTDDHAFWTCGEVVDDFADVLPAIDRAAELHRGFRAEQEAFAAASLGDTSAEAPTRAAREILAALAA